AVERELRTHELGVELELAIYAVGQHGVEAAEAAGGERLPGKPVVVLANDGLVEVPHVDRRAGLEAVADEFGRAVPYGLAATPAVFGAFPDHADASTEVRFGVRPPGLQHLLA